MTIKNRVYTYIYTFISFINCIYSLRCSSSNGTCQKCSGTYSKWLEERCNSFFNKASFHLGHLPCPAATTYSFKQMVLTRLFLLCSLCFHSDIQSKHDTRLPDECYYKGCRTSDSYQSLYFFFLPWGLYCSIKSTCVLLGEHTEKATMHSFSRQIRVSVEKSKDVLFGKPTVSPEIKVKKKVAPQPGEPVSAGRPLQGCS